MLFSARRGRELEIHTANNPGKLAEITGIAAKAGVNIKTLCGWSRGDEAVFHMVTENNGALLKKFRNDDFQVTENEVALVLLDDKIGAASVLSSKLVAAGIDLEYCYGSTGNGSETIFVLKGQDIDGILTALS